MSDVLFLGGPLDGQRLPIADPLPHTVCAEDPQPIDVTDPLDPITPVPDVTVYFLHQLAGRYINTPPGRSQRRQVYAAAGYEGPWRP